MSYRLPSAIRAALDATGRKWTAEERGGGVKLFLAGTLVGAFGAHSERNPRLIRNIVAQIRRAAAGRVPPPKSEGLRP